MITLLLRKKIPAAVIATYLLLSGCSFSNTERQYWENAESISLKEYQRQKIEDSTVLIKREFQYGSGVIIAKAKNRDKQTYAYYVLTARHSVEKTDKSEIKILDDDYSFASSCSNKHILKRESNAEAACNSVIYSLYTNDGKQHLIDYANIIRYSKQLDLALVRFESKNDYRVASLASKQQIEPNSTIYVSGYRGCDRPELDLENKYELTTGRIKKATRRSRSVLYTNFTIGGMSGGGVFNEQGKLIAIHQRADKKKQYNPQDCFPLESQFNDLGNNWGTAVAEFLEQKEIPLEVKRNYRECTGLSANSKCPRS